jgi:putative endonuclease
MSHNYFIYILSNKNRTVLYVGVTRNIPNRLAQHKVTRTGFAFRYNCFDLVYYEHFTYIIKAIAREKQIKKWSRIKKDNLIKSKNPDLINLINEIVY